MTYTVTAIPDRVLSQIPTGVPVYDNHELLLGAVTSVYATGMRLLSAEDAPTPVIPTIAGMFIDDARLPELVVVRLGRTGFIKVAPDRGLLTPCYYITPEQIDTVDDEAVVLKVPRKLILRC